MGGLWIEGCLVRGLGEAYALAWYWGLGES